MHKAQTIKTVCRSLNFPVPGPGPGGRFVVPPPTHRSIRQSMSQSPQRNKISQFRQDSSFRISIQVNDFALHADRFFDRKRIIANVSAPCDELRKRFRLLMPS